MRIAMLSCNTGEGHNSTAKAVAEVLRSQGAQCQMIDVLACFSEGISKFICDWFSRLYKYAPKLWDVSYRVAEHKKTRTEERVFLEELLSLGKNRLRTILEEGDYDGILCVHIFAALMMTELRRTGDKQIPCFFVTTDYTCYPYMDRCDLDGYFIPSKELTEEYLAAGIPRHKLLPYGIPVREEFYSRGDRREARQALGLSEDGVVAILMCGSMGCGPMRRLAEQLPDRLPEGALVVAMCGRNKRLFRAMQTIGDPRIRVLGFCENVSEYMDAADLMITKPGGLSCTEFGNKHLPTVLINAVGGCESRNFTFFLSRGLALGDGDSQKVLDYAGLLAAQPQTRAQLAQALSQEFQVNSAEKIAQELMKAVSAPKKELLC